MCKSKIHRATVTEANLAYEGSITVDETLMEAANIVPYEMVQVFNVNNGQRFETYAIPGEPGTGKIVLNGATAHLGKTGDRLTIMSFANLDEREAAKWHPRIIVLGEKNAVINERGI